MTGALFVLVWFTAITGLLLIGACCEELMVRWRRRRTEAALRRLYQPVRRR